VDKSFVLVKFQMIMASLNYKYYLRANLSLLNAELYQLELMVMISFIFFSGKLAVEQGFLMSIILRSYNDARNGFKSSKTPVFSNRIVTMKKKDELLQQQNDNINSLEFIKKSRQAIIGD
jgi:hypothetical protein